MNVKIKKLHPNAIIPKRATNGSAAFDFHAFFDEQSGGKKVRPDMPLIIGTKLAFEIPAGHAMFIFSRSGHGFKNDVRLSNCVGVIDSDYRQEVKVKLAYDMNEGPGMYIGHGERIAQGVILPVPVVEFEEVDELSDTDRVGGFGSTGK